jgi:hypothetical protein
MFESTSTPVVGECQSAEGLIGAGRSTVRITACEDLELEPTEQRYDLAFAVRVGALDGRHPDAGARAMDRIARALVPGGRLFVDGGDPLRELHLSNLP